MPKAGLEAASERAHVRFKPLGLGVAAATAHAASERGARSEPFFVIAEVMIDKPAAAVVGGGVDVAPETAHFPSEWWLS